VSGRRSIADCAGGADDLKLHKVLAPLVEQYGKPILRLRRLFEVNRTALVSVHHRLSAIYDALIPWCLEFRRKRTG
jgi:hypothetical protein